MKKVFTYFLTLLLILSFQSQLFSQKYETDNFTIQHPELWRVTNDDGIVNVFPDSEIGAITISGYKELKLTEEQTRKFILDVIGSKEDPSQVKTKKVKNGKEYSYQYLDEKQNAIWVAKVVSNVDLLYLVTIFCENKYWNGNFKNLFLESYNSFKLKK